MDHIFHKMDIEEICVTAKQAIIDTKDCIEDIKGIAAGISGVAGSIPAEARVGDVGGTASSLQGELDKDSYDTAKSKLETCKERACSIIPISDSRYAEQMEEITQVTLNIKKVLEELEEFMLETPLTTSAIFFSQLVEAKRVRWENILNEVEIDLEKLLNNVKGTQLISTAFSLDPVNLCTGNFIYDIEDLRTEGEVPFLFSRFYNSRNNYEGVLGKDWNHNYEIHLTFEKSTVTAGESEITILLADGKEEHFLPVDKKYYTPSNQSFSTMKKTEEGYIYVTMSGDRSIFDQKGNYVRQEDINGSGYSLSYEMVEIEGGAAERLVQVTKDSGEYFALTYNENGKLRSVVDQAGRSFYYEIINGRLYTVVCPNGGRLIYDYDGSGKLISVTNPRGICTLENEFDENHRTTFQRFPDGTSMSYVYNDEKRMVTMTERNGAKTSYIHDEKFRNIKNIYPDGEESFAYNSRNQKTRITDKLGNVTHVSYDNRGNLTGIVDPLGTKLSITYNCHNKPTNIKVNGREKQKNSFDRNGNLVATVDALGRKTVFSYNEKGKPIEIKKADGSSVFIEYDEKGNIIKLTDENGNRTIYTYDALNRVESAMDPKGNIVRFTYDISGNIKTVTNAVGDMRTYEYNESNKVTKIIDFDGSVVQRTYNALNKPQMIIDQLGRKTELSYDAMWNLARITAPDGGKTTYIYNENNRLTRVKDAEGNVTRYTYDGNGNCLTKEDATGETIRFTYNAVGNITYVEKQDICIRYAYDQEGHLTCIEDNYGNSVVMEYDDAGQIVRESNSVGEERIYTYTALGKIETVMNESGEITTYTYLPGGKLEQICYLDGTKEKYTYDINGNLETQTGRDGMVICYEYDSLNRITAVKGENGETRTYSYDPIGNVTAITDVNGHKTRYEYSLTGKVTRVIDSLGNETEYTYDLCDRLIKINQYGDTKESGHVTTYERDILGRIKTVTDPLGIKEHYKYDPKGRLVEKLDKEGYLTRYEYTLSGDISRICYADGKEVKLSYNSLRQLEEIEDWFGITTIENDVMGRVHKVQYPNGNAISYTYGKKGERKSITYPNGRCVLYDYDEQMRLVGVKDEWTAAVNGDHLCYHMGRKERKLCQVITQNTQKK